MKFVFIILLLSSFTSSAHAVENQAELAALVLLKSEIQSKKIYPWTKMKCLNFVSGRVKDEEYFYFSIYEIHRNGCAGDPATSPLVDTYRINRASQNIEVRNRVDGNELDEWLPI